jgi:hypothetical protein
VDPKVLVPASLADAITLLGPGSEMKRERVSASRSADEHDRPIAEQLFHAEGIPVERHGALVLRDKKKTRACGRPGRP